MFDEHLIDTPVGALAVRVSQPVANRPAANRPAALLWHSLFVDARSWGRVEDDLAEDRRLVMVNGPGHGTSRDRGRRYTMTECADAAALVLDVLGIEDAVDWVGNAWGGHVGIIFAARRPERCRTLVAVGTPVHAYSLKGRLETRALLAVHRLLGPSRFLTESVTEALLSTRTRTQDPAAVDLVRDCFLNADRAGLRNAVVSISVRRDDLTPLLPSIRVPTLFVTGDEHPEWPPELAETTSRLLPQGSTAVLQGAAYLGPLEAPEQLAKLVREFWATQGAHARSQ
jgi:pimeloyl-ACP methyl ester carboxylesterase